MMFFYLCNIENGAPPVEKLSPELLAIIKILTEMKMFKEFVLFTREKDIKYTLIKSLGDKLIFQSSDNSYRHIALLLKEIKFIFINQSSI